MHSYLEISLLTVSGERPATIPVKQTSVHHCPQQMAGSGMDVALWITCGWYIRWWKELQYTGPLSISYTSARCTTPSMDRPDTQVH